MPKVPPVNYARDCPNLQRLLKSGLVYLDPSNDTYYGWTDDGVEVQIGNLYDPLSAERYLEAHPSPKDW